jgi:hypothetical protein
VDQPSARLVDAFNQLRLALEKRGITVQGSERCHPFFNAILNSERRISVFVVADGDTHFSWTGKQRHPVTDVNGCASEIMRDLLRKERATSPTGGSRKALTVERRLFRRRTGRRG